jgi:hypothetical protein
MTKHVEELVRHCGRLKATGLDVDTAAAQQWLQVRIEGGALLTKLRGLAIKARDNPADHVTALSGAISAMSPYASVLEFAADVKDAQTCLVR